MLRVPCSPRADGSVYPPGIYCPGSSVPTVPGRTPSGLGGPARRTVSYRIELAPLVRPSLSWSLKLSGASRC